VCCQRIRINGLALLHPMPPQVMLLQDIPISNQDQGMLRSGHCYIQAPGIADKP